MCPAFSEEACAPVPVPDLMAKGALHEPDADRPASCAGLDEPGTLLPPAAEGMTARLLPGRLTVTTPVPPMLGGPAEGAEARFLEESPVSATTNASPTEQGSASGGWSSSLGSPTEPPAAAPSEDVASAVVAAPSSVKQEEQTEVDEVDEVRGVDEEDTELRAGEDEGRGPLAEEEEEALRADSSSSSALSPGEEDAAVLALLGLSRHPSCSNISGEAEAAAGDGAARFAMIAAPAAAGHRMPVPAPAVPPSSQLSGGKRPRAVLAADGSDLVAGAHNGFGRYSPIPKPDGDAKFFCKFPGCGKGYASTDAVRKHCRQRHLEWLRRLGHGCPALYCHWGDEKP
jgi:hypothetical protein